MAGVIPPIPQDPLQEGVTWRNWLTKVYQSRFSFKEIDGSPPTTISSVGNMGEIRVTSTHVYFCIAKDTWRRVALTTW